MASGLWQRSGILFKLVANVLSDPAYLARLEAHCRQFKSAVANSSAETQRILTKYGADEAPGLPRCPRLRKKPKRRKW